MAFITIGDLDELQLQIPTIKEKNWGKEFLEEFVQRIVEHDHTGNGKGVPIGSNSLADDGIAGTKILLEYGEYLRSKGQVLGTVVNLLRLTGDDEIEFAVPVNAITINELSLSNDILTTASAISVDVSSAQFGGQLLYTAHNPNTGEYMSGDVFFTPNGQISHSYVGDDLDLTFTTTGGIVTISSSSTDIQIKLTTILG